MANHIPTGTAPHAPDAPEAAPSGHASTLGASEPPSGSSSRRSGGSGRLLNGARLSNRYRIVARLGAGGMGEVSEAFDELTSRTVALKCLSRLAPESLLLFKREFRLLADLYHPNLARLGELASDDDVWFFTMERVHGEDFVSYARREGESALRAALGQLAEALAFLHREGRVHRDIKPHNVLVEPSGRVVVLDFGLVRDALGADATQSIADGIRGTPIYMAPEQAAGAPAGPAADYYALGVMLYEALTGRAPFEGSLLAVLVDKQTKVPTAPSLLAPGVAADLDALCLALLRADAKTRAGAAELGAFTASAGDRPPSHPPVRRAAPHAEFVGRSAELELLEGALRDTNTRAVTVALEGESGVGKSALARKLAERARASGALVLAGRCFDRENVPYKVLDGVVDSLARQLARLPEALVAGWLPRPRETAALLETFPVLRTVEAFDRVPRPPHMPEASEHRRMLFSALRELFERIAVGRPLVVVVDDLQWADADSHVALAELLVPNEAPPVLWVFTMRPGAFERFVLPGDVRRVQVGSLAPDEALALAGALGCDPATREAIVRESGGHPMFLRELSIRAKDDGPSLSLDDSIAKRVAQLDDDARVLLEVVSLAGCPLPVELALKSTGLREERASRAIAITRAEFLLRAGDRADDATIEPYHDRVRETVAVRLDADRTMAHRSALARALAGSELAARRPDIEAAHLRAAGDKLGASEAYVRAGTLAARATAFDVAVAAFREALALGLETPLERADVLERLGEALANAGRPVEASEALLEAAAKGGALDATRRRRSAGIAVLDSGDQTRAKEILEPILVTGGESWPAQNLWFWVRLLLELVRAPLYRWRAHRVDLSAPDSSAARTADLLVDISIRLAVTNQLAALWFSLRAMDVATRSRDPHVLGRVTSWMHGVSAAIGRPDARWDEIAARCEAVAGATDLSAARRAHGRFLAHFFTGALEDAITWGRRFEEHANRVPTGQLPSERLIVEMFMFWSCWIAGDFSRAASVREGAREAIRRRDPLAAMFLGEQCFGAWLTNGDLPGLREALRGAEQLMELNDVDIRTVQRLRATLMVNLVDGDRDLAREYTTFRRIAGSIVSWTMSARIALPPCAYHGVVNGIVYERSQEPWAHECRAMVRRFGASPNALIRAHVAEAAIGAAIAGGEHATIERALDRSICLAREAGYDGLRVFNEHRLGRFVGGPEGRALVEGAEAYLRAAGIRHPRMAATLLYPLPDDDFAAFRAGHFDPNDDPYGSTRSHEGAAMRA